jgi:outer membrane protein assembly factor BamB
MKKIHQQIKKLIHKGRVYISPNQGEIHCIDQTTGARLWTFYEDSFKNNSDEQANSDQGDSLTFSENGMLYYTSLSEAVRYALNSDTGQVAWKMMNLACLKI